MVKVFALIVAGGCGERFSSSIPKQYTNNILYKTVSKFCHHPEIDEVAVVIRPQDIELYEQHCNRFKLISPIFGGPSRGESVKNGLNELAKYQPDLILIHDSNRPYLSNKLISKIIKNLKNYPYHGVIPTFPITETVKRINQDRVENIDRTNLYTTQTPQGFYFNQLLSEYNKSDIFFTDESNFPIPLKYIQGEKENIKITYKEDVMEITSTGIGFDAHKFFENTTNENFITLGGVKIPFSKSIEAHSDGDVLIHAVVDALLGAMGEGDIGLHFPPSDIKWKNANSIIFLEHCLELLNQKNARINNIDVTIICEQPKLYSFKESIRLNLSKILRINHEYINIKATTTEKMGFTGRGEGIAVQAIATILRP